MQENILGLHILACITLLATDVPASHSTGGRRRARGYGRLHPTAMTRIQKMPVLFIGHGSPMNAIEDNAFTRVLEKFSATLPAPKAVCVVSAHWVTRGSQVHRRASPHDSRFLWLPQISVR